MANKKATENILIVSFGTESKTYQAFSDLKQAAEDDNYFISQGSVVKKENGEIIVKDEFDTGLKAVDDTLKGGLIGGLVGLLGGPLGSLLGGSVGALIGDAKDTGEYCSIPPPRSFLRVKLCSSSLRTKRATPHLPKS